MHFKINLTLISVLAIFIFFNIPFYNNWLHTNLLNQSIGMHLATGDVSTEHRKVARYGYSYLAYQELCKVFKNGNIKDPVVLLPPDKYFKEHKIKDIVIVEPAIFYYFTGYKAVWYNSPDVQKASFVLMPDEAGRVMLQKIGSQDALNKLIDSFKKYKID